MRSDTDATPFLPPRPVPEAARPEAPMTLTSLDELRALYPQPTERVRQKVRPTLDRHCRHFIGLSPFVVISTSDADLNLDASPRGGDPGFVRIVDDATLLLPDAPGNNRLDSLENIVATGRAGLLFLIPGIDETLRVNGRAALSTDAADIAACTTERRAPRVVIRISVTAAYLHCAKAFMRSRLWAEDAKVNRSTLPTIGEMIRDQTGLAIVPESREEMARRYAADL